MSLNTAKTFSLEIEKIANEKKITHMEAVLDYCYRNDIEPDTVGNLISKSLKEKIEAECERTQLFTKNRTIASMKKLSQGTEYHLFQTSCSCMVYGYCSIHSWDNS